MANGEKKSSDTRRQNRMVAVQFLYMWDINRGQSIEHAIVEFFKLENHDRKAFAFAESVITGTLEHLEDIDPIIQKNSQNWVFSRIAKVDLAILRLAIYELLYRKDIPPIVSINEAIDIAKSLSGPDSKRFVNGILDKIKDSLNRPMRTAEK